MNYYNVLNVEPDASYREIKKAYSIMARKYSNTPEVYLKITEAFETLKNPVSRLAYNESIGINVVIKPDQDRKPRTQSTSRTEENESTRNSQDEQIKELLQQIKALEEAKALNSNEVEKHKVEIERLKSQLNEIKLLKREEVIKYENDIQSLKSQLSKAQQLTQQEKNRLQQELRQLKYTYEQRLKDSENICKRLEDKIERLEIKEKEEAEDKIKDENSRLEMAQQQQQRAKAYRRYRNRVEVCVAVVVMITLIVGILGIQKNNIQIVDTVDLQLGIATTMLQVGQQVQLEGEVIIKEEQVALLEQVYFSTNPECATIDEKGMVTAHKEGETQVGVIVLTSNGKYVESMPIVVGAESESLVQEIESIETIQLEEGIEPTEEVKSTEEVDIAEEVKSTEEVEIAETIESKEEVKVEEGIESKEEVKLAETVESTTETKEAPIKESDTTSNIKYGSVNLTNNLKSGEITIHSMEEREVGDSIELKMTYTNKENVKLEANCYRQSSIPGGYSNSMPYDVDTRYLYATDDKTSVVYTIPKKVLEVTQSIGFWFSNSRMTENVYIETSEVRRLRNRYSTPAGGSDLKQISFVQEKNNLPDLSVQKVETKQHQDMVEVIVTCKTNGYSQLYINYLDKPSAVAREHIDRALDGEKISLYLDKDALGKAKEVRLIHGTNDYKLGQNIYKLAIK